MSLSRRKLLKIGSSTCTIAVLAGCSGSDGNGGGTQTPTETPTPTPTQTATEQPESAFELTEVRSQTSLVESEQEITVAVTVENVGSGPGSTSVAFTLDVQDTTVETDTVEPGDSTQVTGNIAVPLVDPGRYSLTAELDNGQSGSTPIDVFEVSSPGLYGSLVSPVDTSLAGNTVRLISTDRGKEFVGNNVTVGAGERFTSSRLRDELDYNVSITFLKNSVGEPNGIPILLGLVEKRSVTNDAQVFDQYTVPRGYQTQVQLVDGSGNPVPNFDPINVRDRIGNGIRLTTDSEGYLIGRSASEPGITLPPQDQSNIILDVQREGQPPARLGNVYGSEDGEEFTIEITDPDQYRN